MKKICKCNARIDKVFSLHDALFEKNVNGKVSDSWYMHLSQKYEAERNELEAKIEGYRKEIARLEDAEYVKEQFIHAIRRFMEMQRLTPVLLHELIDRIEVHNIEGTGKSRTQRITIRYKFVCVLDIPTGPPREDYSLNTRQGVEVTYLTGTVSA